MSLQAFGQLLLEAELKQPRAVECAAGEVAWFALGSPDKQSVNEDALALFDLGGGRCVLALADGMGGHAAGEQAAARALQALGRELSGLKSAAVDPDEDEPALADAILSGFDAANRAVLAELPGSGSTLVAAEIDGHRCRLYHAGDSGALIIGGRGRLLRETIPHSPVGFAVEAGVLEPEEALHHGDRHLVSNIIGSETMHVGVSTTIRLKSRDVLLLASDGLFDNLRSAEIAALVPRGRLTSKLDRIASAVHERMVTEAEGQPSKPDDLGLLAFRRG